MIAEITIGKGDVNAVWDKIINKVAKNYYLSDNDIKALKNYDIISLSSEVIEVTYQKTKNMVGLVVSPIVTDDYNPIKLYIITSDDDVLKSVLMNDSEIFNKLYNEFLLVFDEDGLGVDIDVNIMDKVDTMFWKYLEVFNYLGYSSIKFNKLQLEESQDTGSGRVLLKRKWVFTIMKSGTIYPLIEAVALSAHSHHDKGYL